MNGHYWTLRDYCARALRPPLAPPSRDFESPSPTIASGTFSASGRLSEPRDADTLLILVHGLGGSGQSAYLLGATAEAHRLGIATLRLNLRGADCLGEDFYHAGLTTDLAAVLTSKELTRYRRLSLLGYSLGGHVCLRYAAEAPDPRMIGIVAVCSPLDLAKSANAFDRPRFSLYRRHVLLALKRMYREVAKRRAVPLSFEQAARIDEIREWDERIVAPHHGFDGALDYYAKVSVAPLLTRIERRTLIIHAEDDPIVPTSALGTALSQVSPALRVHRAVRGGHSAFPKEFDLGEAHAALGLDAQVVRWLLPD